MAGWSPCPGRGGNRPFPQHRSPSACPLVSAAAPAGPEVTRCPSPAALATLCMAEVPCPTLPLCLDTLLSAACPPPRLSSGRGSAWNVLSPLGHGAGITCPSQCLPLSLPAQQPSTHSHGGWHVRGPILLCQTPPAVTAMSPSLALAPPANTHYPPLPSRLFESADASGSQVRVDQLRDFGGLGQSVMLGSGLHPQVASPLGAAVFPSVNWVCIQASLSCWRKI